MSKFHRSFLRGNFGAQTILIHPNHILLTSLKHVLLSHKWKQGTKPMLDI